MDAVNKHNVPVSAAIDHCLVNIAEVSRGKSARGDYNSLGHKVDVLVVGSRVNDYSVPIVSGVDRFLYRAKVIRNIYGHRIRGAVNRSAPACPPKVAIDIPMVLTHGTVIYHVSIVLIKIIIGH